MTDTNNPLTQPTTQYAVEPAETLKELPEHKTLALENSKPTAKKNYALITGASSGIGEAFAQILASKKKPLILVGRNEQKLKALSAELRQNNDVDIRFLLIDLARSKDMPQLPSKLKRMGIKIDVLINCAGFGKHGLESQISYEDALNMINLNCRATLSLTKLFLPEMLKDNKGAIINIAALAGLFPVPFMATYSATKAFVINYTQALAEELKSTGVKVLCACPGPTATNFYKSAGINTSKHKSLQDLNDPHYIAEQTLQALKDGKTFTIIGAKSTWSKYLPKLIPRKLLLKFGASLLRPDEA
ncbi:SDR family oxidoreductase [Patescibacteria group bacterium]|nr:SDR family oxidoreductase [Patescibacteria group bacterium]